MLHEHGTSAARSYKYLYNCIQLANMTCSYLYMPEASCHCACLSPSCTAQARAEHVPLLFSSCLGNRLLCLVLSKTKKPRPLQPSPASFSRKHMSGERPATQQLKRSTARIPNRNTTRAVRKNLATIPEQRELRTKANLQQY